MPSLPSSVRVSNRALLIPAGVVLLLSAVLFGAYLSFLAHSGNTFNDFFVFWSAARELQQAPLAQVYDPTAFQAFTQSLMQTPLTPHPFVYPPFTAFLFMPFGLLPFRPALLLWDGLSMGLYLFATWHAIRPRSALALTAVVAPASMINLVLGQNGLLTSGLALLGFSLLERRPIMAGVVLGLLAIKPQLAALPLLILLFAGKPRTALAAGATVAFLAAASLIVFGADAWLAWLSSLGLFSNNVTDSVGHREFGITVYFALLSLGQSPHVALAAQGVALLAVLWTVVRTVRHDWNEGALMAVLVAPFLAAPYAMMYDLPVISSVCLLLVSAGRRDGFRDGELLITTFAWCLPLILFTSNQRAGMAGLVILALLLVMALRRAWQPSPTMALEPQT
jgi:alpha-1,2-mannosyltransferase